MRRKNAFFMKKFQFILLFTAALLGFYGCEYNNEPCRFHKSSIYLKVKQSEWLYDSLSRQFYVPFDVKELTADVYNYGNFSLHREYNTGSKNAYQVALPQSVFMSDTLEQKSVVYYTQYVDYRLGIGFVEIQLTNSDYLYGQDNPETMYFRLQAGTVTRDLTVNQADWQFDAQSGQYYYHFDLPELTAEIYDYANWTVCREYSKGTTDAYQVQLPASMFMTDTLATESVINYTQHVDYRVYVGTVEVQLTNSDHLYFEDANGNLVKPNDMTFHLQLTY